MGIDAKIQAPTGEFNTLDGNEEVIYSIIKG